MFFLQKGFLLQYFLLQYLDFLLLNLDFGFFITKYWPNFSIKKSKLFLFTVLNTKIINDRK